MFSKDENLYNGSLIFEPPKKIKHFYYRCSKKFIIQPIKDMFTEESKYGIVLVSGNCYQFYNLTKAGNHVEITCIHDSSIKLQKKQKKGGQSAPRFERIRQEKENAYIKKISEKMVNYYLTKNNTQYTVKGLIIGGPANIKQKLLDTQKVQKMFGDIILKTETTSEINSSTVWEVYEKCLDAFASEEENESLELIKEIKEMMEIEIEKLVFGYEEIFYNLKNCMLEKLLISTDLDEEVKNKLNELNTYNCKIIESNPINFKSIGVDIIGIKWY